MSSLKALQLTPQFHHRVWGGKYFKVGDQPIGEAWLIYEHNVITNGEYAGQTLQQVTETYAPDVLGVQTLKRTGKRFPLLIKILDCADWLSLQVHPNDAQAKQLEGVDQFGKTEAWHILQTHGEAQLIAGLKDGCTAETVAHAIRQSTILDQVAYHHVSKGDTIFIPAGTIHALGPGLLLYEVQQTSDITYRVFDWNRPQTNGRVLHIDKSLSVTDPAAQGQIRPSPTLQDGEVQNVAHCEYFSLELMHGGTQPFTFNTQQKSFHTITITEGAATVSGADWSYPLQRFESVIIPAACGLYTVQPTKDFYALKSSVE